MPRNGLLLLNLGTPDEPTPPAVRRYLREFLGDPRVLDINGFARALLLNLVILPRRPKKSAHAYASIWDAKRGSPLMFHSQDLAAGVAQQLGAEWHVELAMRYAKPTIEDAIGKLAACEHIVALPLFPQWADSSTGTAVARITELAKAATAPPITFVPEFFDDPGFLGAFEEVARPILASFKPDHVLFSYHGLPERHIKKNDATGTTCLTTGCCERMAVPHCYRAQCYATTKALVPRLGLAEGGYTTCFQSRLGRTPWIQPFTDVVLDEIAKKGVKRLAVMCPAFVADCLETLEEIGMRAKEQFIAAGGEELILVPSLNATRPWVEAVAQLAIKHAASS